VPVMPGPRIVTNQQQAKPATTSTAPQSVSKAQPANAVIPIAPKPAQNSNVSKVMPIAPKPAAQNTATEIKSENLKDFKVTQPSDKKITFNQLTDGRVIKIAVMPGELVQTSPHFRIERKPSKPGKDGREIWKIHAHRAGHGWIKIIEKKDGQKNIIL